MNRLGESRGPESRITGNDGGRHPSAAPVIFTLECARAARASPRRLRERSCRMLPGNGGVVMATFVPGFLTSEPKATLAHVADHMDHIRKVTSADHVGIGGDFDGITTVPAGLEDVSKYPGLTAELLRRGWSKRRQEGAGPERPARDAPRRTDGRTPPAARAVHGDDRGAGREVGARDPDPGSQIVTQS